MEAFRLYLHAAIRLSGVLSLTSLGLGDDLCKEVAESLMHCNRSSEGAPSALDLTKNPAIGLEGYEHILWLLNRAHRLRQLFVGEIVNVLIH